MDRVRTVFLDRDGVINRKPDEGQYVTQWAEFNFLPGAVQALLELAQAGIRVVVVTNQRGIALGRTSQAAVDHIHARMLKQIQRAGGKIDGVMVCPHDEGECDCRKPSTGLFHQAVARVPQIDLSRSIVVGDSSADIEAANRLGCPAFLVGPAERRSSISASPNLRIDGQADSLLDLVRSLLTPTR